MRPLLAALLLLPAVGSAQTLTLTVNGATKSTTGTGTGTTTTSTLARNASGCTTIVAGGWVGTSLTTACTSLQLWLTTTACGSAPSTTNSPPDYVVYTAQAGALANGLQSDTFQFNFNVLPSFSVADAGTLTQPCGSAADFTDLLCAAVTLKDTTGACTSTAVQANPVNIRYLNIPPSAPVVGVTPLDSKLSVRLTANGSGTAVTDIQSFQVWFATQLPDGGTTPYQQTGGVVSTNNPNVTISNLTNGITYLVEGYSVDVASNVSLPSAPVPGEPVASFGFYANYIDDGGKPGCGGSAAGGVPSVLAFALVLLFAVARRRG